MQALNGGSHYKLNEAASLVVTTDSQEETDRIWNALLEGGGVEVECGWLRDRFGLSWQVVPRVLIDMLGSEDKAAASRAFQAMLKMKKIIIDDLQRAYRGS